ncbi:restriction endonuclease subunit S [Flavobacterium sp. LB3P21]|uniref:restriction endonuclease subunit S n=1 Tax=Flavobacterium sp. LB3P21 TaxID=3401719 RepID=UPI003AAD9485
MIDTTYKQTAIGLIPSDWEVKKVRDIAKAGSGGTPSTLKKTFWNGDIRWMNSGELNLKYVYEVEGRITEEGLKKSSTTLIPVNCILIGLAGQGKTRGTCAINKVELCTNQSICYLIPSDKIFFQYLYFNLDFRYDELRNLSTGDGGRGGLNLTIINGVFIPLPPLPEQQKIASVLSTWDIAIDNCKLIIEKLKVRNKGLTQKLFTEDFEQKHLSEIFERVTTKNTEKNQNVITISAQRGFVKQTDFFNKIIASDILDHYTLVKKGDFCYNKSYSNGYDWGATKRLNDFEKAVVTTLYICFRLKDENQNSGNFFEYYFESGILYKGLSKVANEGGRAHGLLNVTSSDFFNIKIGVPTFEKQKAIADILDKATEELNQYQQKLQALQLQKKGLMQQLLTGKTRTV